MQNINSEPIPGCGNGRPNDDALNSKATNSNNHDLAVLQSPPPFQLRQRELAHQHENHHHHHPHGHESTGWRTSQTSSWNSIPNGNTALLQGNNNTSLLTWIDASNGDNMTADTTTTNNNHSDGNQLAFITILLLLLCVCAKPVIPNEEQRQRLQERRNRARQRMARQAQLLPFTNPIIRQSALSYSLLYKQIITSDRVTGTLTLGPVVTPVQSSSSQEGTPTNGNHDEEDDLTKLINKQLETNNDSGLTEFHNPCNDCKEDDPVDDRSSACVICLEPFRVGDVVAWSNPLAVQAAAAAAAAAASTRASQLVVSSEHHANQEHTPDLCVAGEQVSEISISLCKHVFHRECIELWLKNSRQQHDDCPSCRMTILHCPPHALLQGKQQGEDDCSCCTDNMEPNDEYDGRCEWRCDDLDQSSSGSSYAFVIIHGLVARARRASLSLLGASASDDTEPGQGHVSFDDPCGNDAALDWSVKSRPMRRCSCSHTSWCSPTALPQPFPFRRASSLGDRQFRFPSFRRPSLTFRQRRRDSLGCRSASIDQQSFLSCHRNMRNVDLDTGVGERTTATDSCSWNETPPPPPPFALRSVVSAGPSTPGSARGSLSSLMNARNTSTSLMELCYEPPLGLMIGQRRNDIQEVGTTNTVTDMIIVSECHPGACASQQDNNQCIAQNEMSLSGGLRLRESPSSNQQMLHSPCIFPSFRSYHHGGGRGGDHLYQHCPKRDSLDFMENVDNDNNDKEEQGISIQTSMNYWVPHRGRGPGRWHSPADMIRRQTSSSTAIPWSTTDEDNMDNDDDDEDCLVNCVLDRV